MAGPESIAACSRLIKAGRIGGIELANIHAFRATTYRKEADYSQAIADFTQAIQLMENLASPQVIASAYVARASAYSLKGDVENALADYRKAVALDSDTE